MRRKTIFHINYTVKNTPKVRRETISINATVFWISLPISYYSNTSATQRILLRGETETNPWPRSTPTNDKQNSKKPTAKRKTPICSVCEKTVRINSKRIIRTYCKLLTHLHCTNTKSLTVSDTKNTKEWTYFLALELICCFTKWGMN